ncbi:MAG: sulfotransferase [Planctomycetes bacterium]|nr:sulfotransferase [Planctomycetota bacterium]
MPATDFENRYGRLDRILHRLAFATRRAQLGIADLEERTFRRELASVEPGPSVFVTALPRAGTTILLELLAGLPPFATHTYRDMPFVLCPLLWRRFTGRRQAGEGRERAHGDGIRISLDSPEAFEEIVWMAFHSERYRGSSIAPWTTLGSAEFAPFFAAHRRKLIALRRRTVPAATRYLSKNNLNVARLPALFEAVPDATVLIPFRDPVQHAASLHRLHLAFTELHARDRFARRYMAGIGHFDFGHNLKPVDFGGWLQGRSGPGPDHLQFWLEYWEACYRAVLDADAHAAVRRVCFERLGRGESLDDLAAALDVEPGLLAMRASILHPANERPVDVGGVATGLVARCRELYAALDERSLP